MILIAKILVAFATVLTYPPVSDDAQDTFVMDLVCNLDDDCSIVVNRNGSYYRTGTDCEEDEPCWNCATMGNRICGPNH